MIVAMMMPTNSSTIASVFESVEVTVRILLVKGWSTNCWII